jgi:hypothetical protein
MTPVLDRPEVSTPGEDGGDAVVVVVGVPDDATDPAQYLGGGAGPIAGSLALLPGYGGAAGREEGAVVPSKSANVKNKDQYEALKDKGMSKERAAKIANSPGASKRGGEKSHSGSGSAKQGGTTAQHKAAGRKGGKAAARKS